MLHGLLVTFSPVIHELCFIGMHFHCPLILKRGVGSNIRKVGSYAMIVRSKSNEAGCIRRITGSNAPCPDVRIRAVTNLVDLHNPGPQIN